MGELTKLQRLILSELDCTPKDPARSGLPMTSSYLTASHIADRIWEARGIRYWERKPTSEAESVAACLRRMALSSRRMVARMGRAGDGGSRYWRITALGSVILRADLSGSPATEEGPTGDG